MPLLGRNCPVISFMNVDLPAPFGPSSPVMPGGTLTLTSLRPMTWRYHFDTLSAETIGGPDTRGAGAAGSGLALGTSRRGHGALM